MHSVSAPIYTFQPTHESTFDGRKTLWHIQNCKIKSESPYEQYYIKKQYWYQEGERWILDSDQYGHRNLEKIKQGFIK